jgi:hypothetical protein
MYFTKHKCSLCGPGFRNHSANIKKDKITLSLTQLQWDVLMKSETSEKENVARRFDPKLNKILNKK